MFTRTLTLATLAAAAAMLPTLALTAQEAMPKVSDLLFERRQLDLAPEGSTISYKIMRTNPTIAADAFTDDITLKVEKVAGDGKRDVGLQIFTGERARDPQLVTDVTGNPVLVLFLDRAVRGFNQVAGGSTAYLKNRFRVSLGESATVEPIKIEYQGKQVDGYKVSVSPFVKDPNKMKMQGYEGSTFALLVSPSVPGYLYEMKSTYQSTVKGAAKIEETIKVVNVEAKK